MDEGQNRSIALGTEMQGRLISSLTKISKINHRKAQKQALAKVVLSKIKTLHLTQSLHTFFLSGMESTDIKNSVTFTQCSKKKYCQIFLKIDVLIQRSIYQNRIAKHSTVNFP